LRKKVGDQVIQEDELSTGSRTLGDFEALIPSPFPLVQGFSSNSDYSGGFLNLNCLAGEKVGPEGFWAGKMEVFWRVCPPECLSWHGGTPPLSRRRVSKKVKESTALE
jgi:hypothetical protein